MKKITSICICYFIFGYCFSQVGQWTWMSGDSLTHSVGNYGTQGIPDIANSPPAVYEPCDWQDQEGNFWVFGGFHNHTGINGDMADLWKYNPTTNEWTWMKGSGIVQDAGHYGVMGVSSPLNNPSSRGWGTPTWSFNGNLWLYGGSNRSNDLWKYEIATNEWTWMKGDSSYGSYPFIPPNYGTINVPSVTNTPGTRAETTTSWTDDFGNLWLFGGGGVDDNYNEVMYNDLWKYDVYLNQWVWMKGSFSHLPNDLGHYGTKGIESPINRPPARSAYAKWKDMTGNFYFMGGFWMDPGGYNKGYNDVWKYNIYTNNWVWIGGDSAINDLGSYADICITLPTNIPASGFENRATCFDSLGNVYMFGYTPAPYVSNDNNKNELWHYSIPQNQWTLLMEDRYPSWGPKGVSSLLNTPPKTSGSLAWFRNNEVWIFGGSDYGNFGSYNSMWKFTLDPNCFPFSNGVETKDIDNEIVLFPNPSNSSINVSFESNTNQTIEMIIYDVFGSIVFFSKVENPIGRFEEQINIQALNTGIYILQLTLKDKIIHKTFIKE